MRTTLDIDDDLLQVAKEEAQRKRTSVGKVISRWARRGLTKPYPTTVGTGGDREEPYVTSYGFEPLPPRLDARLMTLGEIEELGARAELEEHNEVVAHWMNARGDDADAR